MVEKIVPLIPASAWVAETAVVRGSVSLGEHVSIWFGAVLRGDEAPIAVGDESNIQDGAVVHVSARFPCQIGRRVTIGHRAVIHGCVIEDEVLIGMGAIILDGAHICKGAVVGAGALVVPGMEVPANTLALGVPAAVRGVLNEQQRGMNDTAVNNYLARKEAYRQGIY